MAKMTGKDLIFILGAVTVTANEVISILPRFEGKKSESTGMGDDWDTFLSDLTKGGGFDVNGYDDSTGSAAAGTLRKAIEDVWSQDDHADTFAIRPSGTGSGLRTITGTVILDNWNPTWDKAETSLLNASFTFNGAATLTTQ